MTASYYLWKWADNALSGPPNKVYSELLHGRMHPAIQAFDPAPVVRQLEQMATAGRPKGEEWDWQVHQEPSGRQATFIFLTCPSIRGCSQRCDQFSQRLLQFDISGYDEESGQLIHYFPPKKNYWECCEVDSPTYDVIEVDLPTLLQRSHESAPILYNRRNDFVQCCGYKRRFMVEWHEQYDLADQRKFGQWRAGYLAVPSGQRRRFASEQLHARRLNMNFQWEIQPPSKFPQELILYADALQILRIFLRGEPRPSKYHWQDIASELK